MTDIDRPDTADTPAAADLAQTPSTDIDDAFVADALQDPDDASIQTDDSAIGADPVDADPVDDSTAASDESGTSEVDGIPPQYGVGPFSIREAALGIVWLFAFVTSFFAVAGDSSVWTGGLAWILTIGVPTVAVFLIVLRRLSPTGIRRVGSLGIDQFASVAFAVSAVVWIQEIWATIATAQSTGFWTHTWVMWVQAVLMLAGVVLTVGAKWLPVIGEDFRYREEVVAQPAARPIRAVSPRPVVERPVVERPTPVESETVDEYAAAVLGTDVVAETGTVSEAVPETVDAIGVTEAHEYVDDGRSDAETVAVPVAAASQAFWALVPVERDVVDEHGVPLFRIGPTAWALVIEDRGSTYVVRNDDGRVGYLRDVSGVTRG